MEYIIIGAGIGGLTTALAFEKFGINYKLFEQAHELNEVGAGIWLAPNALQVLESLNLLNEVKAKGNFIDRITIGKQDLSPLSDNFQDDIKNEFGYSSIAIHRAELQKLLMQKVPKEKVRLGHAFKSYKKLDNGKVEVLFTNDTKDTADFLIGADGINSKVRKQLFPKSKIRQSEQICWRGITDIEMNTDFKHWGIELWGNQIRFGISQVSDNKVYWFAVASHNRVVQNNTLPVKDELARMFSDFHPIVNELIISTHKDKILKNEINDLAPLHNWYNDNICLIGDAGHATTPNMGQGGAQAIEDAYYLSNLIKSNHNRNVFSEFQAKRKKKVNAIVNQSWTTGKMAHLKYGQGFRNLFLKSIPKSVMQKKMMQLYTIEKLD